jgi:drug/metabolite transporter (DMT)-like permease
LEVLGALFSILSAAAFALNNASVRRGVISGTPIQAMAISVPLGVVCFLPIVWIAGELGRLTQFPAKAAAWMAGLGVLHFVVGRYFNFKANQVAGTNLTAPVIQLQAVVTMVLAVAILHEPCTLLQTFGGVVMVAGSLITQRQPPQTAAAPAPKPVADPSALPPFIPLYLAGYVFAMGAAIAYGTTPIMARFALAHTGPSTGILGGLIAYIAATAVVGLVFLASPPLRRNARGMRLDNARWFAFSGVLVAAAQGFFFCAVALAPVLFVMPLLQTSLAFRMVFSTWLSPHHEVFGGLVIAGVVISLSGALLVSMDSGMIVQALALPDPLARVLLWRL